MTEQEILEGNKNIAAFMGAKLVIPANTDYEPYWKFFDSDGMIRSECSPQKLKYTSDWNWLMPVVEKIETEVIAIPKKYRTGFLKNATASFVSIDTMFDDREEFKGWSFHVSYVLGRTIVESKETRYKNKIEATYAAVVDFIQWCKNNID